MKSQHLLAALVAAALLTLGALGASAVENRIFDAIAPVWSQLGDNQHSLALERIAYERDD